MALILTTNIDIDCNNLSCVTFGDTTGTGTPTSYGGSNPSISEITETLFTITDSNGDDWTPVDPLGYLPNDAGTSTICLKGEDFTMGGDTRLEFVKGETYHLVYEVDFIDFSTSAEGDFLFPCCGSAIESNLATDYSITELLGCTSIKFTDTTGTYNADDNTGGYGTPNPSYDDIDSTLIRFTFTNGTVVDVTNFIPTEETPYIIINSQTLGFGDNAIPSQVVTVEYFVYGAGKCRIGYKSDKVLFRCQLENCIAANTVIVFGSCSAAEVDAKIKLRMEYEDMVIASQGNIDCVIGIPEKLYKKCSQNSPPCG